VIHYLSRLAAPPAKCSKWYEDPLSGHCRGMRSMPDLRRISPQKDVVVPNAAFVNGAEFQKVTLKLGP
jgi:hypothetical protein